MLVPQIKVPAKPLRLRQRPRAQDGENEAGEEPEVEQQIEIQLSYSAGEALRTKDFGSFTWEEVQACKALLKELAWRIEPRKTRRKRPTPRGRQLDMRAAAAAQPALRRRAARAGLARPSAPTSARWWSCATSAARWSATAASCSSSSIRSRTACAMSRRSCSARA